MSGTISPFRLDLTAWALRRDPRNLIDQWDGRFYRRALLTGGRPIEVAVEQLRGPLRPLPTRRGRRSEIPPEARRAVARALDRLLGLRADRGDFYRHARRDAALWALAGPSRDSIKRPIEPRAS